MAPIETCFMVDLGFATCDGYQRQTGAYVPCKPGDTLNGIATINKLPGRVARELYFKENLL